MTLTEGECVDLLVETRGLERDVATQVVEFFDQRTGLLVRPKVVDSQKALRFAHRTVAEYLQAYRFTEQPDGWQKLLEHAKADGASDEDARIDEALRRAGL